MNQLRELSESGKAHTLLQPVIYRLFGYHVRCGAEYISMENAIISENSQDALVTLTAPRGTDASLGCIQNPFTYDGVNQLVGFLLNNSLRCGDDQFIHVSEGFQESRQWEPLLPGTRYIAYASAQDIDPQGMEVLASSYVFEAKTQKLVQCVAGIRFKKISKAVLNHVLRAPKTASLSANARPAATQALPAIPDAEESSQIQDILGEPEKIAPFPIAKKPLEAFERSASAYSTIEQLLATVAAEVGVNAEDMTDEAIFGDLGVDSLMAITVLSTLRNVLGLDLPPTFFMDYDTVGAAKAAVLLQIQDSALEESTGSSSPSSAGERDFTNCFSFPTRPASDDGASTRTTSDEAPDETSNVRPGDVCVSDTIMPISTHSESTLVASKEPENFITNGSSYPDCKIVLLQGNAEGPQDHDSAPEPTVFLLAGDTGSATGYLRLPRLGTTGCVYGINWPTAGLELESPELLLRLAGAAAQTIAIHAGSSPCILGGAGFGAILAYETARRLSSDKVAGLLLFNPPATGESVLQTRDRLATKRILRPIQRRNIEAAERAVLQYRFQPHNAVMGKGTVLVIPDTEHHREQLSSWVPGADVRILQGSSQYEDSVQLMVCICRFSLLFSSLLSSSLIFSSFIFLPL